MGKTETQPDEHAKEPGDQALDRRGSDKGGRVLRHRPSIAQSRLRAGGGGGGGGGGGTGGESFIADSALTATFGSAAFQFLNGFGAFEYHAPNSVGEATKLLARLGEDAKVLSGGHPATMLAFGVEVVATDSGGERRLPIASFFTGPFSTALKGDEIVVEIRIPTPPARSGGAYLKLEQGGRG